MFYKFHSKSPWLKKVLVPFWVVQLVFMLALIFVLTWLRGFSGFQTTNFIVLIISAVCTIVSVIEIILFAATRLHPLTYLILQLVKTIIWLMLFTLATLGTITAVKAQQAQGVSSEYVFLAGFVETLVLFITFFAALIYASVVYHRHRRTRARFLRSLHSKDLFPVIADEVTDPVGSQRVLRAPRNSIQEMGPGQKVSYQEKEALEVTVLRELGGDWELPELPATRSMRSSKGGKSVKSLKSLRGVK